MPRHGEIRNYRIESESRDLEGEDGRGIFMMGMDQSVEEKYCAHCRRWIEVKGVYGALGFMADHQDGDCCKEG